MSDTNTVIEQIFKDFEATNTIVWCGAGISFNSGIPTANEFVKYLLDWAGLRKEDLEEVLRYDLPFEAIMQSVIESSLCDRLFDTFDADKPECDHITPNENHRFLAKLVKSGKLRTIVTTNFDQLIEKALDLEGLRRNKDYDVVYREQDFLNIDIRDGWPRVIKIHGCIRDREGMAITIQKVANKYLSEARLDLLRQILSTGNHECILVLGYSSSDSFDLCPGIESISENLKKVIYVEDTRNGTPRIEDLIERSTKNPFKMYKDSFRLYINTDDLIKELWNTIYKGSGYDFTKKEIKWHENIEKWYSDNEKISSGTKYTTCFNLLFRIGAIARCGHYSDMALRMASNMGNLKDVSRKLSNLGVYYGSLGQFGKAIEYNEKGLQYARETDDRSSECACLANLGTAYCYSGDLNKAIDYSKLALETTSETNDRKIAIICLSNFAEVFKRLKDFNRALYFNMEVLKLAPEIGDQFSECKGLGNLGAIYCEIGQYSEALSCFTKAIEMARLIGDRLNEGRWLGNLGGVQYCLGNMAGAAENYTNSIMILSGLLGENHPEVDQVRGNMSLIRAQNEH